MSEKNEPIFENEEFLILLQKYEMMKNSTNSTFFDVEEFEQIIDYYLDEFLYDKAAEAAEIGTIQHPASVEIKYKIVHIYLEQGMGKKALEMLDQLPRWEHSNSEFFYLYGTALCLTGKIHDAEKNFDTGLTLSTEDNFEALLNISIAFENARHFHLAIKYLEKAHAISPDYLSVLYDLGYFYERLDQYKKSIEYYQRYLDIDPFSENVWYNLGVAYFKLEQYSKAIEAYDYSIAINPDYASAYFNKANTYGSTEEYDKAIETISEFLLIEPENTQAVCFLADCYEQKNDYPKALEYYKKVIELDNTDSEGWFGAGMVYYLMTKYEEAIIYLLKALELDGKNTDYWINLGYIYEESNRYDEALKCYRQVVKIDKSDVEGWSSLGNLLLITADYNEALVMLHQAFAQFPEDEGIAIKLAECYYRMNKPEQGLRYLEVALRLSPDIAASFKESYKFALWDKSTRSLIKKYKN